MPQRKLLIWMKKRGIVRTVKDSLQGRQQVVSRTEITSVVQMTFKDLHSSVSLIHEYLPLSLMN